MKIVRREFLHFAGAATALLASQYVVRAQVPAPKRGMPPQRSARDRLEEALATSRRLGLTPVSVLQPWYNLVERGKFEDELRAIALRCAGAFGIDLYGVDIVESEGTPYVVDMCSIPGFKGVPDAPRVLAEYFYRAAERATRADRVAQSAP